MRQSFLVVITMLLISCGHQPNDSKDSGVAPAVKTLPVNLNQGRTLYATCKTCHGNAGEGILKSGAPALSGNDHWYLKRQLLNFANGLRGYHAQDTLGIQMAAMAKVLKDSMEIENVLAFIESLPDTTLTLTVRGDIVKGERIYQSVCGSCHGPDGKGNEMMNAPRLSGLNDWYIRNQLIKFKTSIRGAQPQDTYGAQMVSIVPLLKDEQSVSDVIAYITSTVKPAAP